MFRKSVGICLLLTLATTTQAGFGGPGCGGGTLPGFEYEDNHGSPFPLLRGNVGGNGQVSVPDLNILANTAAALFVGLLSLTFSRRRMTAESANRAANEKEKHCRSPAETVEAAGPPACPGADYFLATTYVTLGAAFRSTGDSQSALPRLATARELFEGLSTTMDCEAHRRSAARLAARCLADEGDCLSDLGQLDAAALKYEESIRRSADLGDRRQIATGRFRLGTVRLRQRRYTEALTQYHASRETSETLGDSTAVAWRQIGRVLEYFGRWDEAEAAYSKARSQDVNVKSHHKSR